MAATVAAGALHVLWYRYTALAIASAVIKSVVLLRADIFPRGTARGGVAGC